MSDTPCPGSEASVEGIIDLAAAYHATAAELFGARPANASRAPARLCSIHAIELYLNAFLRFRGVPPDRIRAHPHDLSELSASARGGVFQLRKKTARHLIDVTAKREYPVVRYAPEQTAELSEISRLTATLEEISKKVRKTLGLMKGD